MGFAMKPRQRSCFAVAVVFGSSPAVVDENEGEQDDEDEHERR